MEVAISGDLFRLIGFLYRPHEPEWSGVEVMAAWRRAIELSLGDEDTANLKSIAQSRTEPASRIERARIFLAYREGASFLRLVGCWGFTIRQSGATSNAPWSKPLWLRSTIARVPAGNRGSRSKPRLGWYRWRAGKPKTWAILTNCGRRGFSPVMPERTDRGRDMRALLIWRRARCAKS
jgi:hypothetical protein